MARFFGNLLANLAYYAAASAEGLASFWSAYQPKEPAKIQK